MATNSASPSISSATSGADAVLFAGRNRADAATGLNGAVSSNPRVKLFVPSALADPSFVSTLSVATQRNLLASAPAGLG